MTFALSIGAFELESFVELNVRSCRNIFGSSTPILLYCGACRNAQKIKDIADRFDCAFVVEEKNRAHFLGDLQNAVCAIAFAQANNCDVACKINQRWIPLGADIPDRLEEVFSDPKVALALPPQIRAETIHDSKSKFHAKFPFQVDFIAMRASAFDAQGLTDRYAAQVQNAAQYQDTLTESFWAKLVEGQYAGRFAPLPWLSEPAVPPLYLRKAQSRESDYAEAAKRLGMCDGNFPVAEWSSMLKAGYRPMPRA